MRVRDGGFGSQAVPEELSEYITWSRKTQPTPSLAQKKLPLQGHHVRLLDGDIELKVQFGEADRARCKEPSRAEAV